MCWTVSPRAAHDACTIHPSTQDLIHINKHFVPTPFYSSIVLTQIDQEIERKREFLPLVTVKECQVDDRMFLPLVTVRFQFHFLLPSTTRPLPARYPPTTSSFSVSRWHPSLVLKREKDEQAPDLFSFSCRYFRFFHLVALEPRCLS